MNLEDARARKAELIGKLDRSLSGDQLEVNVAVARGGRPVSRGGRRFATAFSAERSKDTPTAAVSVGLKPRAKNDYGIAVRVQTARTERQVVARLAQLFNDKDVDFRVVGQVRSHKAWYRDVVRPLRIGASVGHANITAGTIGGFVSLDGISGSYVLSNNHVLADVNKAKTGDPVLQPGPLDNLAPKQLIAARFSNCIPLSSSGLNLVDCAIAEVDDSVDISPSDVWNLGRYAGIASPYEQGSSFVLKVGRTTGLTWGRITAIELDPIEIDMGDFVCAFGGQIEVEGTGAGPFSQGGDSGSLVLDMGLRVVGLLFAGSTRGGGNGKGLTYVNPIGDVLSQLGAKLIQ